MEQRHQQLRLEDAAALLGVLAEGEEVALAVLPRQRALTRALRSLSGVLLARRRPGALERPRQAPLRQWALSQLGLTGLPCLAPRLGPAQISGGFSFSRWGCLSPGGLRLRSRCFLGRLCRLLSLRLGLPGLRCALSRRLRKSRRAVLVLLREDLGEARLVWRATIARVM